MMTKTVLGIFPQTSDAELAIKHLEEDGYNPKDISIVMKDKGTQQTLEHSTGANVTGGALSGATTGAVVGGIAGLLAGTVLPALGGFLIGGPIGAALGLTGAAATTVSGAATGAVAGGLLGALVGLGVPEKEAKVYEERVNAGGILVAVPTDEVTEILEEHDATDVQTVTHQADHKAAYAGHTHTDTARKHTKGQHRHSQNDGHSLVNPIELEKHLKNVNYPATRQHLMRAVKDEGGNEDVHHTLAMLPTQTYSSPVEVSKAIGEIE
jgi:uncharacterized membrane protein